MDAAALQQHKWYRLRTQLHDGAAIYESVAQVLAVEDREFEGTIVVLNYRPLAGTSERRLSNIVSAELVPWRDLPGGSREGSPARLPRRV
jgi:hypothetical protein